MPQDRLAAVSEQTPDEAPSPMDPLSALPDGSTAVGSLLSAIFGGGVVATWVRQRGRRKDYKRAGVVTDIREAQDRLEELRALLRRSNARPSAISDDHMIDAEQAFEKSYYRVGCNTVYDLARDYVAVGRLFAARDPETGVGAEEKAYHLVARALADELSRRR